MKLFKQMLTAAAIVLASHTAAQAAVVQIQMSGLNLTYDEALGNISTGGSDPLVTMTFLQDGALLGILTTDIAATIDMSLVDAPDPTLNATHSVFTGGIYDLSIDGVPGLWTNIVSGSVTFSNNSINATGTGFSNIFFQNLPFGLTAYDPINWSFSTGLGNCTGEAGYRTCTYAGTGELSWTTPVPEPAMLSLLSIGLLGLGLTMRRRAV